MLAPNSRYRERITPTRNVKDKKTTTDEEADGREGLDQAAGKCKGMCCTQGHKGTEAEACFQWGRLGIDVSICSACGGPMKIIASIEDPFVIGKILSHLGGRGGSQESATRRPRACAPPPAVC